MLELVTVDGIRGLLDNGLDLVELLDYVLRGICCELVATSIRVEQEQAPALNMAGAMLGGLFGVETTSTDDLYLGMFGAGRRLREQIGAAS